VHTTRETRRAEAPALPCPGRTVGDLLRRIPAAAVLIPLTIGAIVGTCAPGALGPITSAAGAHGALPYVAAMLFCVGGQIQPRALPRVGARVGVVLIGATVVTGMLVVAYGVAAGPAGVGGVSVLAVAASGLSVSNALWLALAGRYGSGEDVAGGMAAAAVNAGPAMPLLLLGIYAAGGAQLPVHAIADALAPLGGGFLVGLLWPGVRPYLARATPLMLVAMSYALGCEINVGTLAGALVDGAVLGLVVAVVSGALVAAGWVMVLRQPPAVGWAAGGVAVGSVIVPGIVAAPSALPAWAPYAVAATAQVAVAVITSNLVAAALTAASARRHRLSTVDISAMGGVRDRGGRQCGMPAPRAPGGKAVIRTPPRATRPVRG
jgi:2-keto-3-deoxygluconate permease